jgi:hypothetical protein
MEGAFLVSGYFIFWYSRLFCDFSEKKFPNPKGAKNQSFVLSEYQQRNFGVKSYIFGIAGEQKLLEKRFILIGKHHQ